MMLTMYYENDTNSSSLNLVVKLRDEIRLSFTSLDTLHCVYAKGAVMIVFKVCYDQGGSTKSRGARFGPEAIEAAFYKSPWRGAEDGSSHPGIHWVRSIASLEIYRKKAESLFSEALMPFISLSGDNSCSFETVRVVAQHVKHVALAVLDAHPDACDFDHDPHAYWVRKLWDEGIVTPEKTIFFGIRDPEEEEMQFIQKKRAMVVTPNAIDLGYFLSDGVSDDNVSMRRKSDRPFFHSEIYDRWQPFSEHALVIIVDIDVLDPACAPGTGVLRAGGLNVRDILNIIRRLCTLPFMVKIGEICEVIPEEGNILRSKSDQRPDPCGLTVLAAEAIFREMIRSMEQ